MPDEFSPDLGGLESDYRLLSELRRSPRSRTYLARHLGLNRDVSVVVLGAPRNEHDNSLSLFASDARTLSVIKHANVLPVIDSRWLPGGMLAIVRPRIRGQVVDDVAKVEGPIAASRVASVIAQVASAVAWARDNGIVHRSVSGAGVRFQQGSGRVVVEMEFAALGAGGGVPDECDDARTIGRLAFEMLAGRHPDDPSGMPLAELRADLSPRVLRELSAAMNCDRRGAAPDLGALVTALAAVPDSSFVPRPPTRVVDASVDEGERESATPETPETSDRSGMSFGAKLVLLAVVSTAVGAAGTLIFRREPPRADTVGAKKPAGAATSAGEVARRPLARDSTRAPSTSTLADTQPPDTQPPDTQPRKLVQPPPTRRHEPLRGEPPATLPPSPPPKGDSSKADSNAGSVVDVCESSDAEDQHSCLTTAMERGDRTMNAVYARLIAALRRQARTPPADPDPATVIQLRLAQRSWLASRDVNCRTVGEAPLYAVDRAQCYADEAEKRMRDLQQMLDAVPS